ncbi:MAG TPA: Rieske 2Fe-2S domain-containing protein, partial [Gaiellales bacterium]|nr:Rieske 2Fe-2S domain-containing protein [Gaiellales bacterium]
MAPAVGVGTTPVPVAAGDRAYVLVRLQPGGEVSAFPARCPHRLVPLRTATVHEGRLQCPAHGWRFDSEGRCVDIPSLGSTGSPPPRADLAMPWAVEERHGWVWLAPDRTAVLSPPRPAAEPVLQPAPAPIAPRGPVFGN